MPNASTPPTETLSGVVDHLVFRSEDTGYTVCVVKSSDHPEGAVVVGTCAAIWAGETLQAEGAWGRHKVHGYQFNARRIVCVEPHAPAGIQKYLASGLVPGIGPVLAERLVKKFGADTLRVIEKESARLETVAGIGKMRREQIKTAWNEQKAVRDIMIFLHAHGVSTTQATRIHRAYGDEAIALVKANPYRLAADIWGIGFKTADQIAMKLGVPLDSMIRARAGIVHALYRLTDEGHCFCPRDHLLKLAQDLLNIAPEILNQAIDLERQAGALVQDNDRLYLKFLYEAEVGVADQIQRLQQTAPAAPPLIIDKAIAWAAERMQLTFAPAQTEALRLALSRKVAIITGGPGVGKTTLIRAIVDIAAAKHLRICLAAPTGRAAKRMEAATRRPALTLHRLLKYIPGTGAFEHHAANPLAGDVFILDEVSMIDLPLMQAFLRAVPGAARLILVGDADQLPSVGPGNVLRDLIASSAIPLQKLDTIFRQSDRSWIVHNAHRVNTGQLLELPEKETASDFFFLEADEPERVIRLAVDLITERIPQRFGLNPKTDIQLLTPMRRNQLGVENLNAVLQAALNPRGPAVLRFGRTYRLGDRVMQLRNNYDKDIYNGDIGWIRQLDEENQQLQVDYDGRLVPYDSAELDELSLAYACSIHKSQGSEHPAVVILLTTQHYKLLQRNLLYTALTRGRRLVCLIGSKKAVAIAIRNNQTIQRCTGLRERLRPTPLSPAS